MNSIRIVIFIAFLIAPHLSLATAQESDYIFINNKEYQLNTNPLKSHIEKIKWQPPKEARIWSSNWRGYIAKWEIYNGDLILKDVTIRVNGKKKDSELEKSIIRKLFPGKKVVLADWYSGALILPEGKIIQYAHMGYGSTYERYQIYSVKKGRVVNHISMDAPEFEKYRSKKFEEFSKTERFKKSYDEIKRDTTGLNHEEIMGFMHSFYSEEYLAQ